MTWPHGCGRSCLALPEVTERPSHGVPAWFVRGNKSFAQLWADGHHDDPLPAPVVRLLCPARRPKLTAASPGPLLPPAVRRVTWAWIGVRLDGEVDWVELAELCADAYRAVAPAALAARLDAACRG